MNEDLTLENLVANYMEMGYSEDHAYELAYEKMILEGED